MQKFDSVRSITNSNKEDGTVHNPLPSESAKVWIVKDEIFELEPRYNVKDYLGQGAYGIVCSAIDTSRGGAIVAIKKCKKILVSKTMAKRMLRELRILRFLDDPHIIKIQHILKPRHRDMFSEVYVVFEYMETDLAQIIRSSQVLREEHVQVSCLLYLFIV